MVKHSVKLLILLLLFPSVAWAGASRGFIRASSQYLSCGTGIDMSGWTEFTVTAWIYFDQDAGAEHTIFSNWIAGVTQAAVLFRVEPSGNYIEGFSVEESNTQRGGTFDGSTSITADTWTHVALRLDGSNIEAFVGSTKDTDQYAMGTLDATASGLAAIGSSRHISGDYYQGQMAHIHVYNTSLTDDEIQQVSAHPKSITAGLQAYWPLDGDSATEVDDYGSNDCTVTGATESFNGPPLTGAVIHGGTLQ